MYIECSSSLQNGELRLVLGITFSKTFLVGVDKLTLNQTQQLMSGMSRSGLTVIGTHTKTSTFIMETLLSTILKTQSSLSEDDSASQLFASVSRETAVCVLGWSVKSSTPPESLKWLQIVHRFLLSGLYSDEWIRSRVFALEMPCSPLQQGQQSSTIARIIPAYLQFLKKRSMKITDWLDRHRLPETREDMIATCYDVLNLAKTGGSIYDLCCISGLDNTQDKHLILDLNVLLAEDVGQLYNLMCTKFLNLWQKARENDSQILVLLRQIEQLNAALHGLYYSQQCEHLSKSYIPNWVIIDRKKRLSVYEIRALSVRKISDKIQELRTQILNHDRDQTNPVDSSVAAFDVFSQQFYQTLRNGCENYNTINSGRTS